MSNEVRPKIKIDKTPADKIIEFIALAGILFILITDFIFFKNNPELPFYKQLAIIIVSFLAMIIYTGISFLNKYPEKFNYAVKITKQNARIQYVLALRFLRLLKLFIVWMFVVIICNQTKLFLNKTESLTLIFLLVALIIFLLIKYINKSMTND